MLDFRASFNVFEPHQLPSNGVFYDGPITVSRMRPVHISKMARIASSDGDMKLLVDTIGETIDRDPRTLTPADFEFLLFWHVFCLNDGVFRIVWKSQYGNTNAHDLRWEDLVLQRPALDRASYLELRERGFAHTTTALWEDIILSKTGEDLAWLYDQAQFFTGDSWRERSRRMNESGLDGLREANEVRRQMIHGVTKVLNLSDENYDEHAHLRDLVLERNALRDGLRYLRDLDNIKEVMRDVKKLEDQIDSLRLRMASGTRPVPDPEMVSFAVMASDFVVRF